MQKGDAIRMTAAHPLSYPEPTMRKYMATVRWVVMGVYDDGDLRIRHLNGGRDSRVSASQFEVAVPGAEQAALV